MIFLVFAKTAIWYRYLILFFVFISDWLKIITMAMIAPAPEDLNLGQVENEEVLTLLECPVSFILSYLIIIFCLQCKWLARYLFTFVFIFVCLGLSWSHYSSSQTMCQRPFGLQRMFSKASPLSNMQKCYEPRT